MPQDETGAGRRRTAVLVSGMHRSGTSVMTRLISLLGAALPGDLVPGRRHDNVRGFFEGRAVVDVDDTALGLLGSWWGGWQQVEPDDLLGRAQVVAGARDLVREDFEGAETVVIKDPRISRLLPLWQQVLTAEGFRCVHVVAVRSPAAVVASLERRNHLSSRAGVLSWLAHSLDAEQHTREESRVFVSFERLLEDWRREASRMSAALGVDWSSRPDDIAGEVEEFIEPGLVHGADPDGSTGPVRAVRPVYDVLRRWSADDVRGGDAELLEQWRRTVAPVRAPSSAVALVARERQQAISTRGGAPEPVPRKRWTRIQNRGFNAEADVAWAWFERERRSQHDTPGSTGSGGGS